MLVGGQDRTMKIYFQASTGLENLEREGQVREEQSSVAGGEIMTAKAWKYVCGKCTEKRAEGM